MTYRIANLQSCILYIYSTNIGTEYFKHVVYSPFFPFSKCSLFHNSNVFGSCIIHILYTGCVKIKENNFGAIKLKTLNGLLYVVLIWRSESENRGHLWTGNLIFLFSEMLKILQAERIWYFLKELLRPHAVNSNKKVKQSLHRPEVPRGFQEVKVPRLRDNRPRWW